MKKKEEKEEEAREGRSFDSSKRRAKDRKRTKEETFSRRKEQHRFSSDVPSKVISCTKYALLLITVLGGKA